MFLKDAFEDWWDKTTVGAGFSQQEKDEAQVAFFCGALASSMSIASEPLEDRDKVVEIFRREVSEFLQTLNKGEAPRVVS